MNIPNQPPPLYHPTPLERAYSSHLLQTYFATPYFHSPTSIQFDSSEIRLAGRSAVPFLTTSGVERSLLRLIWTCADPECVGTLIKRSQFCLILRLVAMAQAHLLPPLTEGTDAERLAMLKDVLNKNAKLVVALPTFEADKNCPTVAYLLGTYPSPVSVDRGMDFQTWSASSASSGVGGGAVGVGVAEGGMSVSDAFGTLPEVEDRPLAPLVMEVPPTPAVVEDDVVVPEVGAEGDISGEDEDFGNFDGVPPPVQSSTTEGFPVDDNFGDFDSVPVEAENINTTHNNNVAEDDFGGFASSSAEFSEPMVVTAVVAPAENREANIVEGDDDDDFGGFEDSAAATAFSENNASSNMSDAFDRMKTESSADDDDDQGEDDDGFGAFGAFDAAASNNDHDVVVAPAAADAAAVAFGAAAAPPGSTLSISDAFDSLVGSQPVMQPTTAGFDVGADHAVPSAMPNDTVGKEAEDDNDGFGDFDGGETAAAAVENVKSVEADDDDGFGDFGSGEVANESNANVVVDDDGHDGFGDFGSGEVAANVSNANDVADDNDGFGGFGAGEMATEMDVKEEEVDAKWSGLSTDDANMAPPSVPLSSGFTGVIDIADTTTANDPADKLSVFDALVNVQDAPLPLLGAFSSSDNIMDDDNNEDDVDGSFGDFAGHEGEEEQVMEVPDNDDNLHGKDGDGDDDIEDFGMLEDAGLEEAMAENVANNDTVASAKEGPESAAISGLNVVSDADGGDNKLSVFDAMADVQDAPLPPLGSFHSGSSAGNNEAVAPEEDAQGQDEDDGFGDFAVSGHSTAPSGGNDITNDDADFGDFEAPNNTNNELLDVGGGSGELSAKENTDGLIGMGASDGNTADDGSDEGLSAFDVFGTLDAPLPSLDTFSSSVAAVEGSSIDIARNDVEALEGDGGFGDFEGVAGETTTSIAATATTTATATDNVAVVEDDDGFGDFEGGNVAMVNDNGVATVEEDHDFGDFEGTTQKEDATVDNDLFDAFSSSNDVLMPSSLATHDVTGNEGVTAEDMFDAFTSSNSNVPLPSLSADHVDRLQPRVGPDDGMGDEGLGAFEDPKSSAQPDINGQESAECDVGTSDDDFFGDFNDINVAVKPTAEADMSDQFGDFEANAPSTSDPHEAVIDNTTMTGDGSAASNDGDVKMFGAFSEIPPPPLGNFPSEAEQDDDKNMLSVQSNVDEVEFEAFPTAPDVDAEPAMQMDGNEEDDFGEFDAFPAAASEDGNFPEFHASTSAASKEVKKEAGVDLFGSFGDEGASSAIDQTDQNDVQEDSFGNFEAGPEATKNDDNAQQDDFGQFEAFNAPPTEEDAGCEPDNTPAVDNALQSNDGDEDFGNFDSFPAAAANEDDAFGQFEAHASAQELAGSNASLPDEKDELEGNSDKIDTVDRPAGGSNNEDFDGDDFGDFSSFEGAKSDEPEPTQKGDLEGILRSKIGDEFGRLPSDWKNSIISTVESDLQRGNRIMDYLSNNLSSADRTLIIKSQKLRDHVHGLAEFVRVVRSIAATIGELLKVEKNIDVQESTLSQWNDNAIIADAVVIEYLWSEIVSKAVVLGIIPHAPKLDSVVEIRSAQANFFDSLHRNKNFCQLTLRPLIEGTCTQSPVVWKGKKYMACAANFCANRIPGYAI